MTTSDAHPSDPPQEGAINADALVASGNQRPSRQLSRRTMLKWTGLGSGSAVVLTAGGVTLRAFDQGVFETGEGPAYQAWRTWQDAPAGSPTRLVQAALLAANAHNTQPWTFVLGSNTFDLYADTARGMGTMDPLHREMELSLGCALENLVLAARADGFVPSVALLPATSDAAHVARVALSPGTVERSPLYDTIPNRHTNRAAYDTGRPLDPTILGALAKVNDFPDIGLVWLTTESERARFGQNTVAATEAIIADAEQAADDFAWFRQDWNNIQRRKDGITVDAAGLDDFTRALAKILPHQSRSATHKAWLKRTRSTQVPTAAAFGLIVARDRGDTVQRLNAGRLYQRLHLHAITRGLAMQPLAQAVERADREQAGDLEPVFTQALAGLLPEADRQVVLPFRIGYPTRAAKLSPRRTVTEVTRSA